ncbi:hypothetical protein F6X40_35700 [Paraburkholderia sp. UCT31]|uniref:glyoxalase superfamily protein n=1 Tax=Paraburkholderia sp. UCT31 TaxID=2615209 RepID=UPI001655CA2C|nr:glyoxalase superfamily protein [Paraburkholderia sp. UCT31]MBC8741896.1 hypothetical protein [Paraburkholderia sp. UCT31]
MQLEIDAKWAKAAAARIRAQGGRLGSPEMMSHSGSLEVLSQVLGYKNWDTLAGLLNTSTWSMLSESDLQHPVPVLFQAHVPAGGVRFDFPLAVEATFTRALVERLLYLGVNRVWGEDEQEVCEVVGDIFPVLSGREAYVENQRLVIWDEEFEVEFDIYVDGIHCIAKTTACNTRVFLDKLKAWKPGRPPVVVPTTEHNEQQFRSELAELSR